METEVKEELRSPKEELKKLIQVETDLVEEEVSHSKGKSRAEQKLSADNGAISPTEEEPSIVNDSLTPDNASRLDSSDLDAEVPTVAELPTPVAFLQSNIKDLATVIAIAKVIRTYTWSTPFFSTAIALTYASTLQL